ncbi:MAG: type I restriction endonuclease subunit R [Candidatus Woesearchaeota archaeon]
MNFNERNTVQDTIIRYSKEIGWNYIDKNGLLNYREDERSAILENIFIDKILSLNPFLKIEDAKKIKLELEKCSYREGNYEVWKFLKGLRTWYVMDEKRDKNVRLIDFENPEKNEFTVVDEFTFTNGVNTIRQDIVFFINGIPLIFVECKAPYKEEGISEAFYQVKRYHEEAHELLSLEQIFLLSNFLNFAYGATWELNSKNLYEWRVNENEQNFESKIKSFFNKDFILKLIKDYIIFLVKDDSLRKVVLRPHQIRAVEKIIDRAKSKEKRRGLIWHTQGSGKTYTMIVAAKKIIEMKEFENPTILMLIDRNELENQLIQNLTNLGFKNLEKAESIEHIRSLLKEDRRGLIVSMIHKFRGMEANINQRSNIFVLIDEAHRTMSGELGTYLFAALPNAKFFGFTGTPIDRSERRKGTFETFGKDDPPKGYLDKYGIMESIRDGSTVRLNYTLAKSELLVDKETLDNEYFKLAESEGITDIEENDRILNKAIRLKEILKSKERIRKISKFIADHFKNNVEPLNYKAFIVAVDREACAMYKEEIDKYLPEDYSKVIFSEDNNDPPQLKKYHLSETEHLKVRKDFLDPNKMPKIFIVTNMLLTGFDAPILYCMYLDKPMRDHLLLQTIARVNRPYEDKTGRKKEYGLIVDLVGIFADLKKALSFDSSDIEGVLNDIEELKRTFEKMITLELEQYKPLEKIFSIFELDEVEDKKLEILLEELENKETRELFYRYFSEVSSMYDILSPDEFLRPYMNKMKQITRLYNILSERYSISNRKYSISFSEKINQLVKQKIKASEIFYSDNLIEIDPQFIENLRKESENKRVKIFQIFQNIEKYIKAHSREKYAYLYSLGEKVEKLIKEYDEKHLSTEETINQLISYYEKIKEAKNEQEKTNLTDLGYNIYYILKNEYNINSEQLAKQLEQIFSKYPYWYKLKNDEKNLTRELYRALTSHDMDLRTEIIQRLKRLLNPNIS